MRNFKQAKILVVDDDRGDIKLLKKSLESEYLVQEAQNGLHAKEIIDREHPDLVLLDVMMPKTSGYTLCACLKSDSNTKDIPIVMVTGLGTEINEKIGREMGADGYLVKPISPEQLHDTISRLLSE